MYYLKLFYKILDWEWYKNANVMRVFIHCLLKANRHTKKWQGFTIHRGSFITSYPHLAQELNLSVQQIRTAISKLELTGEITRKQQGSNTLIVVNNYSRFQPNNTQINSLITDEQQASNREVTATKKCNNDINDINDNSVINRCINNVDINVKKYTNPNNTFSPIVKEFHNKMGEILNYKIRLSGVQCDKVIELNSRIPDFTNTIPTVFERLKTIQWRFDDGSIVNADVNWVLEKENYISVLSGKFTTKKEMIKQWKPKGSRDNDG